MDWYENQNEPENERLCCITCPSNERTIVLQLCNQLIMCEDCYQCVLIEHYNKLTHNPDLKPSCSWCRTVIENHYNIKLTIEEGMKKKKWQCFTCDDGLKEVVFFPCKHATSCRRCMQTHDGVCKICKEEVQTYRPLFIPDI